MAQEQEKEPAQLSHIGIDLTEGVVSLFGARSDGLVRFRFYLPQVFQQALRARKEISSHSPEDGLASRPAEL